jgi:hypothetical protein
VSTRRLAVIVSVPPYIKKVFNSAPGPVSPEERLWRERAARMTLDALGHTNLTMKKKRHNEAVRYSRRWFRGMFVEHPDPGETDDPEATFDAANLTGFAGVRDAVLAIQPLLFPDEKDEHLDE